MNLMEDSRHSNPETEEKTALGQEPFTGQELAEALRWMLESLNGAELDLPPREPMR